MKIRISFFFVILCECLFAQVAITGTVKGVKEVLTGANIIAKPITTGAKFAYATSDEKGGFSLELTANAKYLFTISFMGFITQKEELLLPHKKFTKVFTLQEDPNKLEEVIITYVEPVKIVKDTTTYRVDAFTNGKERKLRQVLKKLPGVEVDRKGNITVKGKKVTTLLVENKKFFTGDTKMAVNNIPADVIDKIQVIEDYNESALLKGFESSEEVAINIMLKEGKKNFVFGDLEAGSGLKKRYILHPTLFKYSPKMNVNFIGDFNNTADKSFTFGDYIKYNGGLDIDNLSNVYDSPLVKLLREKDFNKNKHVFGAVSTQIRLNTKNDLDVFVIGLKDKINLKSSSFRKYTLNNLFSEQNIQGNKQQEMLLGSFRFQSKPNENINILSDTKFELSSAQKIDDVNRSLNGDKTNFTTSDKIAQFSVKSKFQLEKRFSMFHTSQVKVNFSVKKSNQNERWFSPFAVFYDKLALENTTNYKIHQFGKAEQTNMDIKLKHFWILNPTNHLYLSIQNKLMFDAFNGFAQQNLLRNSIILNDFSNAIKNNRTQSLLGAEYKKLIGDAFLTCKLSYLNYNRYNTQFNKDYNRNLKLVVPEVNLQWEIERNKELNLRYRLSSKLPEINQLMIGKKVNSFNSIYQGNINLKESYYHFFKLSYRKSNTYGWGYYPTIYYRYKKHQFQKNYFNEGVYNTSSMVNNLFPNKELSVNFKTRYNHKHWSASLLSGFTNRIFNSSVNGNAVPSVNNSAFIKGRYHSSYLKGPNIAVDLSQNYSHSKNKFFTNILDRTRLNFNVNHEFGNWQFNGDFNYFNYRNRTSLTNSSFNNLEATIFYQQEESPWGFELKAKNILDNKYKLSSSNTSILFNETKEYLMPRMLLFKVAYKL